MDLEYDAQQDLRCSNVIHRIVADLFSFNDAKQQRILDSYYFPDAEFVSPLLSTHGTYNIRHVFLLWKSLNKKQPIVDKVCYSGDTCVVFLTQLLCPRLFPLVELRLPVIVTLSFRETDIDSGLVKIFRHHESWTIDDMIHSVPLISYWYDHIVRFMMGKLLVSAGHVIHVTTETIDLLSTRSREIEEARIQLALLNASKAATQRK